MVSASPPRRNRLAVSALACLFLTASVVQAETPLHERIDQAIAAATPDFAKKAAKPADDAEFLRRITLDLTGTLPTAADARAFLKDTAADKRQAVIDRLLASPEHARYFAALFDDLLMERRPAKYVPQAQWREYLRESFAANKPWDQLAREVLSADGADPKQRPAAKFYLERNGEPNLLTRDISRLFLGMNLQCCQCHDHPRIEEYKQGDYYGLYAFLSRGYVVVDAKLRLAVYAEKADGEVTYQSVFDKAKVTHATGPRLPGLTPLKETPPEKGKEYVVAPVKGVRPVPRYSRRGQLGPHLASAANPAFKRASANRLWYLLMGRGLVHPLDMDHPGNRPSHPELLDLLAEEFAALKFDQRAFLRELALSQTYQRSSELPAGVKEREPARFTVAQLKPLSPEQLAWALMQASGLTDAERKALGAKLTEPALYARLAGQVTPFARAFGSPAGTPQEFDATLDQALFLANGPTVRAWLAPRAGNLTDRLTALKTADAVAEELYLSVLTRMPTAEERKDVADYLASRPKDRPAALQEMAWALLASAEFRFNH
jgi:hypothetical protein